MISKAVFCPWRSTDIPDSTSIRNAIIWNLIGGNLRIWSQPVNIQDVNAYTIFRRGLNHLYTLYFVSSPFFMGINCSPFWSACSALPPAISSVVLFLYSITVIQYPRSVNELIFYCWVCHRWIILCVVKKHMSSESQVKATKRNSPKSHVLQI